MATKIITKNSSTASAAPLAADLSAGELAINTNDGKLFYKDSGGTVRTLASKDAAAGTFATLSASGNVTLSAGTANGVLYLNGSKVATSGSALTFDGTSLGVGGVPTIQGELNVFKTGSAPTLYVQSDASNSTTQGIIRIGGASGRSASIQGYREAGGSNYHALRFYSYNAADQLNYEITSGGTSIWSVGGSEQMRLTSTGLGIGTSSPATKLQVDSATSLSAGNNYYAFVGNTSSASRRAVALGVNADGNALVAGYNTFSPGLGSLFLDGSELQFRTGSTTRATLDSSGNLGLGVTPSAWGTTNSVKGFQLPGVSLWGYANTNAYLNANSYFNGSNRIYVTSSYATEYAQTAGQHQWYTAPSGTAGNTITFTQAMTLDASGNLSLGTTSTTVWNGSAGTKVVVGGSGNTITSLQSSTTTVDQGAIFEGYATGISSNSAALGSIAFLRSNTSTTALSSYTAFYTNNAGTVAERIRIDSSGNLLVGTTSANAGSRLRVKTSGTTNATYGIFVANNANAEMFSIEDDGRWCTGATTTSPYNYTTATAANMVVTSGGFLQRSTSSLKYKKNVVDAVHGLSDLMKLRSVIYEGKAESDSGKTFGGLIAEEVDAAGLTEFVQYAEDGSPDALAYGNMVSLCIKAIQEQQAIIEQLKADVAALKGA